ncbi:MAG: DUF4097 family beta strand repeat-containing protein, partial [Burkholderiales bacterium]
EDMMLRTFGCSALLVLLAAPAPAQVRAESDFGCDEVSSERDRQTYCEVREDTLAGGNPLDVDAGQNGGIRVRGWDRGDILIRARVVGYADSETEAQQIVSGVRVETGGGQVRSRGPERGRDSYWVVSYDISVPQEAQLTLNTNNGGISIRDLRGTVRFRARNGGIRLENVGGEIRGETTNGGLNIDLSGERWDGAGLDVETRNGGVRLDLPANYSAELETGTTNGRVNVDVPITVQGRIGRRLTATLGAGGPRIRAITYNGGVHIRGQ